MQTPGSLSTQQKVASNTAPRETIFEKIAEKGTGEEGLNDTDGVSFFNLLKDSQEAFLATVRAQLQQEMLNRALSKKTDVAAPQTDKPVNDVRKSGDAVPRQPGESRGKDRTTKVQVRDSVKHGSEVKAREDHSGKKEPHGVAGEAQSKDPAAKTGTMSESEEFTEAQREASADKPKVTEVTSLPQLALAPKVAENKQTSPASQNTTDSEAGKAKHLPVHATDTSEGEIKVDQKNVTAAAKEVKSAEATVNQAQTSSKNTASLSDDARRLGAIGVDKSDLPDITEKTAAQSDAPGKNVSVGSLRSGLTEGMKGLPPGLMITKLSGNELGAKGELGTKDALKVGMREGAILDKATGAGPASSGITSSAASRAIEQVSHVRMTQLIERVQKAVESQLPTAPRQIAFQIEPKALGQVTVNMQWTSDGWNVNWSVTNREVREWLAGQMPQLQQSAESSTNIIWNEPTLQTSAWDMSRQGNPHAKASKEAQLADEEVANAPSEEEGGTPGVSKEYWA
jgi:hypothetical protein